MGTNYHGWQHQKNATSVQQLINEKISTLLNEEISVVGSSRTDTGVHAHQQFCHFDYSEEINGGKLLGKLNSFLPEDISINAIIPVIETAHSRFDALSRTYHYNISSYKNPFVENTSFLFTKKLNIELMNEGAEIIRNAKDFQAFSKVKTDVNNFNCEVTDANWKLKNNDLTFKITSNRFLRGMVRALVGTLLNVGEGKNSINDLKEIFKSQNRSKAGASVPAKGLVLTRVKYPQRIFLEQKI